MIRLLLFLLCGGLAAAAPATPNVVVILADDLGYGDLRANNPASKIPTPNLDRLAAEGMRFTDAHSPSAVCTPTRYGLITGRYCWRSRMKRGVLNGYSPRLIEPDRRTIANVFRDAGYQTACVGKWHLGMDLPKPQDGKGRVDWAGTVTNGPDSVGFHHYFCVSASLDMPPYAWIEDGRFVEAPTKTYPGTPFPNFVRKGPIAPGFDIREALDTIARHGGEWIAKQAGEGKRFFLYLPLTAPHKPVLPAKRFIGKSKLGPYGDFILAVDDAVGQVLKALDNSGADDNTIVVLTSDNGSFMYKLDAPYSPTKPGPNGEDHLADETIQGYLAANHQANAHLRGTKADAWEGGHRVPFLVRWPGQTPAGKTCHTTVTHTDLMATAADLLGQKLPADAGEDSFSLLPLFKGKALPKPRAATIHHSGSGTFAIRKGPWKLIFGSGSGGRGVPRSKPFDGKVRLYNLADDPSEDADLAAKHPDRVEELTELLETIRTSGRSRP